MNKKLGLLVLYGLLISSAFREDGTPLENPLIIAAVWFVVLVVMVILIIRRRRPNR